VAAIANTLVKFRQRYISKNRHEYFIELIFRLKMLIARCRGILAGFTGKIYFEDHSPKLIIGSHVELLIQPGSILFLKKINKSNKIDAYSNNTSFPTGVTIGARPHHRYIDPPSINITRIDLLGDAKLIVGQNVIILPGSYITGSNNSIISIDSNSYISHEVKMNSRHSITIGKNVLIGHQTIIMDYDGHTIISQDYRECRDGITIEDNVWIGSRVTILKGVKIGHGSIVGANSCVVSDVPRNTIVAGNPAKIIKSNISWLR